LAELTHKPERIRFAGEHARANRYNIEIIITPEGYTASIGRHDRERLKPYATASPPFDTPDALAEWINGYIENGGK